MDISPRVSLHIWRALGIALGLSIVAHALALLFTPDWIVAFSELRPASFEARLVATPAPVLPSEVRPVRPAVSSARLRPRAPTSRRSVSAAVPAFAPLESITASTNHIEAPLSLPAPVLDDSTQTELSQSPNTTGETAQVTATPVATSAPNEGIPPVFPQKIEISYRLASSLTDGMANYQWSREGNIYRIDSRIQATGVFAGFFVGTLRQSSRGEITATGLQPFSFSIQRGDAEPETAEFNRAQGNVTLKGRKDVRTLSLTPHLQDTQSFLFQLAYDMPHLRQAEDNLDVAVTNARKLYQYRFRQLGTEILDLSFGKIEAIHLRSEATNPEDVYEVWLAPQYYFLPVKLKYFMGRFPVEQIAANISIVE